MMSVCIAKSKFHSIIIIIIWYSANWQVLHATTVSRCFCSGPLLYPFSSHYQPLPHPSRRVINIPFLIITGSIQFLSLFRILLNMFCFPLLWWKPLHYLFYQLFLFFPFSSIPMFRKPHLYPYFSFPHFMHLASV